MNNLQFVTDNLIRLVGFKTFVEKPIGHCMELTTCSQISNCRKNKPCAYIAPAAVTLRTTGELYTLRQQIRVDKHLNVVTELGAEFQLSCDIFQSVHTKEYFVVTKGMFISGQKSAIGNTYVKNLYDLLKISDTTPDILNIRYGSRGEKSVDTVFHRGLLSYASVIYKQIQKMQMIEPSISKLYFYYLNLN